MNTPSPLAIAHNTAQSRFEVTVEGHLGVAEYQLRPGRDDRRVMVMTHTLVPKALEGRGIAGQLVAAAMAHARAQGHTVDPQCSYVAAYMQRKPELHDLRER